VQALAIGVSERHHLNYLQDTDNLSALKTLAGRFFSRDLTIRLTQVAPAETDIGNATANQVSSGESRGSGLVNEALRIFGGSIKTVRQERA
jgi:hypothetical protein